MKHNKSSTKKWLWSSLNTWPQFLHIHSYPPNSWKFHQAQLPLHYRNIQCSKGAYYSLCNHRYRATKLWDKNFIDKSRWHTANNFSPGKNSGYQAHKGSKSSPKASYTYVYVSMLLHQNFNTIKLPHQLEIKKYPTYIMSKEISTEQLHLGYTDSQHCWRQPST